MARKQFKDLKQGDKIVLFGDIFSIKNIELSEKGLKQGKTKCRVVTENLASKEEKIIIRLAEEYVNTP
ncbi:MAG: hypothetical protein ABIH72_03210 [archaeon]